MQVYVGDTRSRKLLKRFREEGIGQVVIRGKLARSRMTPWFFDNGAFVDWRAGSDFDGPLFAADMRALRELPCDARPDFYVIPDKVAEGNESARFSREWMNRLDSLRLSCVAPRYFAVQDGMNADSVPWSSVAGIFIGGTKLWKSETAPLWAEESRRHGVRCHFARCGTRKAVSQAKAIGADSIDSSLPLWSRENLRIFMDALNQEMLFYEKTPAASTAVGEGHQQHADE